MSNYRLTREKPIYFCQSCGFSSGRLNNFNRHLESSKHEQNTKLLDLNVVEPEESAISETPTVSCACTSDDDVCVLNWSISSQQRDDPIDDGSDLHDINQTSDEDANDDESDMPTVTEGPHQETIQSEQWFPYKSKLHFLLTVMHSSKTHKVSDEVLSFFLYILKECGIQDVPSLPSLKAFWTEDLNLDDLIQEDEDQNGDSHWMIKPSAILKMVLANPTIAKSIDRYPTSLPPDTKISGSQSSGQKWREMIFHCGEGSKEKQYVVGDVVTFVNQEGKTVLGKIVQFLTDVDNKLCVEVDELQNVDHSLSSIFENIPGTCLVIMENRILIPIKDCRKSSLPRHTDVHLYRRVQSQDSYAQLTTEQIQIGKFLVNNRRQKMNDVGEYLEDIIEKCGGFGRFQFVLVIILFAAKISVTWTMLMMSFASAEPDWWCIEKDGGNETFKSCTSMDNSTCQRFRFDTSMSTVLSEWNLVCDQKLITSSITTIQMGGVLVGGLVVGQMVDFLGRKPTLFFSLFLISAANIAAYFSVSWEMFAVLRFVMGISCGVILTVYLVWTYEFLTVSKRAIVVGVPSWTLFAAIFALVAWLLHDWKHLHLATAISAAPLLLTWWFMPESFRWLVSHKKLDDAKKVIETMAKFNGVPVPDLSDLEKIALKGMERETKRTYTLLDIFKSRFLRKNTLLHAFMWMTCAYVYYAISISGNIYLNMSLLNIVEMPANAVTICLNNKFGRRKTGILFFVVCALGALGVALIEVTSIDPDLKGQLLNGFALRSKLGIAAAWISLSVLSTEVYPMVVRNIGYGFQNTAARVGAMVAPQMVYLSDIYPGLLYFLSTALVVISVICLYFAAETNNVKLKDTLDSEEEKHDIHVDYTDKEVQFTKL